jgi:hypothetical protein
MGVELAGTLSGFGVGAVWARRSLRTVLREWPVRRAICRTE